MSTTNLSTTHLTTLSRPALAPPRPWSAPGARRVATDGGPAVVVHDLPGQHVATVQVHLGIGLQTEPEGADGIATVMAATLEHGSSQGSAQEFTDHLAACGIGWSTETDHTGPRIICHVPATRLGPALALISEALCDPALRPADIAQQTQLLCGRIAQTSADAAARAMREVPGIIFDTATRAGRPADGTLGTLQRLTPHAVTEFHRAHGTGAAGAVVSIAGDLGGIDVEGQVADAFSSWQTPALAAPPTRLVPSEPGALLCEQPGAAQTYLLLAASTIRRDHPDWPALAVAAYILGAPITGRLDARLREERGYSYGMRAACTALHPHHGLFLAQGAVAAEATAAALDDLLTVVRTARDEGFTAAECAAAREGFTASMPLRYENAALVAAQTTHLLTHGLPDDFITQTLEIVRGLSRQEINDAFRQHLDPDRLSLIAVGDPALQAPLAEHLPGDLPGGLRLITP
jgi:predicted Zn-dependent peptidase